MPPTFSRSDATLHIRLLGSFEVHIHGLPMRPLRTRSGNWLLALLVLQQGRPITRKRLADLLWPDSESSLALANLRRSLTDLRGALGPEASRVCAQDDETLTLNLTNAEVDVMAFAAAARQTDLGGLEVAMALYRGPFLPECSDRWAGTERHLWEEQYLSVWERLAALAFSGGRHATAVGHLEAILQLAPWRETALRLFMEAQAAQGDYEAALGGYRDFRARMQRSNNDVPEPETTATFHKIQAAARQQKLKRETLPPPALPSSAIPHSLPEPIQPLRGRTEAIWEVVACFDTVRLVTLTGSGGMGKTQMALHVAREVLTHYPDGVWFIDLAPLSDPAQVVSEVAAVLDVREEAGRSLEATLVDSLRRRQMLLLLDNCEHLLPACATLTRLLLRRCRHLHVLATSRQRLGLTDESVWQVPSLPVPSSEDLLSDLPDSALAALFEFAAVQLFVDRAVQARSRFTLTPTNAPFVIHICRRLDGIPLALELAAVWVHALSVEQIADRLDNCFGLLTRGDTTALPRHQTLQAALDWSYDLLSEEERIFLKSLCVFSGGWTLEAAEQVLTHRDASGDTLRLLAQLVDKSLVVYEERQDVGRYRMLEIIRQYMQQKEPGAPVAACVQEQHLDYFVHLAETAEAHLAGRGQAYWLDRLETEKENFRAALAWACDQQENQKGLRLAGVLWRFWFIRGYAREGRQWLDRLLPLEEEGKDGVHLKAFSASGNLAFQQEDYDHARTCFTRQLALAERLEQKRAMAAALGNLANVASEKGELAAARDFFERCQDLFRELGDSRAVALTLGNLAIVARREENPALACACHEASISLLEQCGDSHNLAIALNNLVEVKLSLGENAPACQLLEQSLALGLSVSSKPMLIHSLSLCLSIAIQEERWERAAELLGALDRLHEETHLPIPAGALSDHEHNCALLKSHLGAQPFLKARTLGRAQTPDQTVTAALSMLERQSPVQSDH